MRSPLHSLSAFLFRRRWRGAVRFHSLACGGGPLRVRSKHGLALRLDPYEYVSALVLRHGYYEEEVLNAVREDFRPGDVFWDIGSCLGIHAMTMASAFPGAKICAFEPNPAMAGAIEAAAKENHLALEVRRMALGDRDGRAQFYVFPGNAGRSGLSQYDRRGDLQEIEVEIASGDALIRSGRAPEPSVIKIDVEGHELDVIQGLAETLRGSKLRRIVFEDDPSPDTPVKTLLAAAGFRLHPLLRLEEGTEHNLENYVATR